MDNIKEAFLNVRNDIDSLRNEIDFIKESLNQNQVFMHELTDFLHNLHQKLDNLEQNQEKVKIDLSTHRQINQTPSTHPSTHPSGFKPLNSQNMAISTGNRGVSTDRQTDRQTDRHMNFMSENKKNLVDDASEILDSLDSIKKGIRLKFKRLTEQEFLVFSAIYQFEEEIGYSDYKMLSNKLNLSESSIRDYVSRIINKGIPVDKNKFNNKNIQLNISSNLKKIATLPTILQLREI